MFGADERRSYVLAIRVATTIMVVSLLTIHIRSIRVFRWEQTMSGGLFVTYLIGMVGLTVCAGDKTCCAHIFQFYLGSVGAVLFALNAGVLIYRWWYADVATHAMIELLITLGMQLRRQMIIKVLMSSLVSIMLAVDLILSPFVLPPQHDKTYDKLHDEEELNKVDFFFKD